MRRFMRSMLCTGVLSSGLAAQVVLERFNETERPPLRRELATIPYRLDDWIGDDEPVDPDIVERAQTTQYLNRVYRCKDQPGLKLSLWINYSEQGTNLRHTPEICLPSSGWSKVESQTRVLNVTSPTGEDVLITRLGYAQGDLVEHVGFWYYIFGEGRLEKFVRRLPITSRSSHGRTTRGSSMTVEIFAPGEYDPDGLYLRRFARALLRELEPLLPADRAEYHVP